MPSICLRNVSTPYCLDNVNLDIKSGEFTAILGHTGAGKSTLLNVIAGLVEYRGSVYYNQQEISHIPIEKRNVGYLLQGVFLFPHLNIFDNIAFGLRVAGYPADIVAERISEILDSLSITHLEKRYPKNLSGGEIKRVGLARSIILGPEILLLDEPFSSLDPVTSRDIRRELRLLHDRLNLTTLYVTHNCEEALELASGAVVISGGRARQLASVREVSYLPSSKTKEFAVADN